MKLNGTFVVFNSGDIVKEPGWEQAHGVIRSSIKAMRWPDQRNRRTFKIPRIVSVAVGESYTDQQGESREVKDKTKTLRNGVRPIRDQFRQRMAEKKCTPEQPLSLVRFFEGLKKNHSVVFPKYPLSLEEEEVPLNQSVGNFDFWFKTKSGFRTVIEWETGNISSSHRSLNKMCLALMGQLVDAAVLVVPSIMLYPHLTDRIGNIRELQPYFYFWNRFGQLVPRGLLAVIEVEQDALFKSTDLRDFVPLGSDGNSKLSKKGQVTNSLFG
jgi:hypothetical protein